MQLQVGELKMKIVFVSNYFNHHQQALSEGFYKCTNGNYYFIETEPMDQEIAGMGWRVKEFPDYVIHAYTSQNEKERSIKVISEADAVIIGSAPFEYVKKRMKSGKLTFRYSERFLKTRKAYVQLPLRAIKYWYEGGRFKNTYMLCASAYTAAYYSKVLCYRNKCFKWGYFPQTSVFPDVQQVIAEIEPASILWVGRLIELKHPDASIQVAKRLKQEGISFKLRIIGNGALEQALKQQIKSFNIEDNVEMLGAMPAATVQEYMRKAQIFITTSDFNEGWGAVVNEAMGNACAVVASHAMGSVPFLIEDGANGFIYKSGDVDSLFQKVKKLLQDKKLADNFSIKAYQTISNEMNGDIAAKRFIETVRQIQNGDNPFGLYQNGLCSKANILMNNWYK